MPRHTHPRSRHRHDRGHIRFHRDRIVAKRALFYRAYMPTETDRHGGAWGYLEDEQAWLGCRRARCGMCGLSMAEVKRQRRQEQRQWRDDWGVC